MTSQKHRLPSMQSSNLIAFAGALVAFILSLLCLTAGTPQGFLSQASIVSVNMSQIGIDGIFDNINITKCKRSAPRIDVITNDLKDTVPDLNLDLDIDLPKTLTDVGNKINPDCLLNKGKTILNDVTSTLSDNIADALNIPDFFDLHVTLFCTGNFEPRDYVARGIRDPKRNITSCTTRKSTGSKSSLTSFLEDRLPDGINLRDIEWPAEIDAIDDTISLISSAIIFFYAVGTACVGMIGILALLDGLFVGFRTRFRHPKSWAVFVLSLLGFLALLIASGAVTFIAVSMSTVVNTVGGVIDIAATRGDTMMGMSWSATALVGLLLVWSVVRVVRDRRERKRMNTVFEHEKGVELQNRSFAGHFLSSWDANDGHQHMRRT